MRLAAPAVATVPAMTAASSCRIELEAQAIALADIVEPTMAKVPTDIEDLIVVMTAADIVRSIVVATLSSKSAVEAAQTLATDILKQAVSAEILVEARIWADFAVVKTQAAMGYLVPIAKNLDYYGF